MKRCWLVLSSIIGFILLIGSCTPKAAAPLQPAPAATTAPQAIPTLTTNLPPLTPQDAWAKIVQAAKQEGRLNVYSVNMTGDTGLAVSRSFEVNYGVKLDIITGGGAALAERIKTEKRMGTMVADAMDANTFQTSSIKDIGATISADDLPALQEKDVWRVDPWANDPPKHKLISAVSYQSIVANAGLLKSSDEPRSLKELALPKWKGKMTALDPRQSSSIYNYFLPLLTRKLIDLDTLQAIGKNDIAWTATMMDAAQNLIRGQYTLCVSGGAGLFAPLVATEPTLPLKLLDMEEGVVLSNLAIALVKDSPHPNAAKLLVNWMFTPEGQKAFAGTKSYVPVRKDVPDFTPGTLRMTPAKLIVLSAEEEGANVRLFQEGYLAKLWGR